MTIRALTCWALCAALVSAQEDGKKSGGTKPATAAEAVKALKAAQNAGRPKSLPQLLEIQDKIIAAAEAVLGFKKATAEQKDEALAAKASALSAKSNYKPEAAKEFEEFAKMLEAKYPNSKAIGTIEAVKFRKKHMMKRPTSVEPAVVKELLALAKKYPDEKTFANCFMSFINTQQHAKGREAAIKLADEGLKVFEGNELLEGMRAGLAIVGKTPEISGPTLEGSEFNISSMKGKVVLVDFWATWCGPCVRELPNVKKTYEKYHEKGFEIVAVSFDHSREPLEKFVKEKELPWTQVVFKDEKDMGWENPIGRKYGVRSIPCTFLIGRDGKVVGRDLHGEELDRAISAELAKGSRVAN